MKVNELQAKFAEVIGEKTRSPNKTFLTRRIIEALQAKVPTDATSPSGSATTKVPGKAGGPVTEKLTRLDVAELQARYLESKSAGHGVDQQGLPRLEDPRGEEGPHPGRSSQERPA